MAKGKSKRLLSASQRAACMRITLKDAPFSQRAEALIELDKGSTQVRAAEVSGLTVGQVRYWIARFRELGMDMFPLTIRQETVESPVKETAAETDDKEKPSRKPKASGKSNKGKKSKKDKPSKKGKKAKKKKNSKKKDAKKSSKSGKSSKKKSGKKKKK